MLQTKMEKVYVTYATDLKNFVVCVINYMARATDFEEHTTEFVECDTDLPVTVC